MPLSAAGQSPDAPRRFAVASDPSPAASDHPCTSIAARNRSASGDGRCLSTRGSASSNAPRSIRSLASPSPASMLSGSSASASRNPRSAASTSPDSAACSASLAPSSASVGRIESTNRLTSSSGYAPMNIETGCPSRKATTVGMPWERTACRSDWPTALWSMSSFARRKAVSAQVTETAHGSLGLAVDDLLAMHRVMLTARLIDEAALRQNRMGRAPFVVPVSGHEGCQIGTAWPLRRGTDVWVPYYRDLGVVLVAGMTPEQIFLGVFSKATDPTSGGRQMPNHWSSRALGIISHSSPIATQVPHAAGIAFAVKYRGEDAVVASWFGEGATSEGDWHEGLNFAAS